MFPVISDRMFSGALHFIASYLNTGIDMMSSVHVPPNILVLFGVCVGFTAKCQNIGWYTKDESNRQHYHDDAQLGYDEGLVSRDVWDLSLFGCI